MRSIFSLLPLLLAAGILLAGNGLQGTLIALRAAHEGFSAELVGFMGTSYFGGFLISSLVAPKMVRAVGHIRVFSALAAIIAAGSLAFILWVNPYWWIALRFLMGFGFAGLSMVIESWLNDSTSNEERGKVLSIYRIVDLGFVTGGQFLLPVFGIEGFVLFAITSMMLGLSLVPVSLADRTNPSPPQSARFDLKAVWIISPIACIGCTTIGLTNASFRLMGPLFATRLEFDTGDVALFMSMGIVGGAVLQFPLGWLSDKYDRRWVLIATTLGASVASFLLSRSEGMSITVLLAGSFAFGAFSLPLYSLSIAHANDRAGKGQFVLLAAGLMFFYSLGASVGPMVGAWAMSNYGTQALFGFISLIHASFVILTVWRLAVAPAVEKASRRKFIGMLRTSPALFKMARVASGRSPEKKTGQAKAKPQNNK